MKKTPKICLKNRRHLSPRTSTKSKFYPEVKKRDWKKKWLLSRVRNFWPKKHSKWKRKLKSKKDKNRRKSNKNKSSMRDLCKSMRRNQRKNQVFRSLKAWIKCWIRSKKNKIKPKLKNKIKWKWKSKNWKRRWKDYKKYPVWIVFRTVNLPWTLCFNIFKILSCLKNEALN